ncbi:M20 family metallopeptidase [Roseomonas sp. NAR14]|uniref:M20 family metallopeptidase n=1 Tax=Roseomonas acroporae TaxID=2937791 RepID=A0A9X2BZV1_9PROT|nr:M20 aminoacylase family protein [Roseomonas acroporae]MCK8787455.1 M20 family metallopeptidase [Roseomonas acroporae]
MTETILDTIRAAEPGLVALRRDLHAHPETGFEERRTAGIVAGRLRALGLDVAEGVGRTGVVGTLTGTRAPSSNTANRAIGLRADMDALNIEEATGLPYASTNPGKMHACGHDGHTAMLLGAAEVLARHRDFAGTVHFIFQPAEEGLGGGLAMLADGLLERFPVDSLYGMHNWPGTAVGRFCTRTGPLMAAGDTWTVTFRGTGGHGGNGAHNATDVTLAQAQFIGALQTIVSRNVPALQSAVVSVGYVGGGSWESPNVIPAELVVRGTARSFDERIRGLIERRMGEMAQSVAATFGCTAELRYERIFDVLVNDEARTRTSLEVARALVGEEAVDPAMRPVTGSEDFAFMLGQCPGSYVMLGNGVAEDGSFVPVHTPRYDFNDAILPLGVRYWAELVHRELGG